MGFLNKLFGGKEKETVDPAPGQTPAAPQGETPSQLYGVPLLESPKMTGETRFSVNMVPHSLYGIFAIRLPADWEPYESDRFRAKTRDETTQLSVTLYQGDASSVINSEFFRNSQMGLYRRFVTEGGYEPYDDLLVKDAFITQSFKVDEETQYYLTSAHRRGDELFLANIIIRNLSGYDTRLRAIIQAIQHSIEPLSA
jgi:hypothetical protein